MNNDELVTRRAQAIAEDRCFSKGRLRDEFRMEPAPGAEPVKWYKNTYGGRFAVYRIADCVPMREKRPLTSKGVSLEIGNFCTLSALFNQLSYAASSYRL